MTRTVDEVEQLRARQHKVEDLRDEEQDERLGKVALDGDGGECHAGEVAEGVAWEGLGGIPALSSKSKGSNATDQLCHMKPAHTPTRGSMK